MREAPFHVVLVEPLIPPNTGSVGRLCVGTGCHLHLIEPLGFDLSEKAVRRAGLDYWKDVQLRVHPSWQACTATLNLSPERFHFFSTHAKKPHTAVAFSPGDVLVFGKETSGLGPRLREEAGQQLARIPQLGPVRSLNLSTAVGIVVYEGLRQTRPADFPNIQAWSAS